MTSQNVVNGKALEWAIAKQFSIQLGGSGSIESDLIVDTDAARTAVNCFESLGPSDQKRWDGFARLGVRHIVSREKDNDAITDPSQVLISTDSMGISGDVRDVVVSSSNHASVGVSCKNNHDAFKHPRLSGSIDFVKEWGLSNDGCSEEYWNTVQPIFDRLSALKQSSDGKAKFDEVTDLRESVMKPVINAFINEVNNHVSQDNTSESHLCRSLVQYVIGKEDFYKVIKDDAEDQLRIMGFNFNGSLAGRRPKLPKALMRLHTASSRVEPSLKFDVQAVGLPPRDVYQHFIDVNELATE
jgi:hypothetical protein